MRSGRGSRSVQRPRKRLNFENVPTLVPLIFWARMCHSQRWLEMEGYGSLAKRHYDLWQSTTPKRPLVTHDCHPYAARGMKPETTFSIGVSIPVGLCYLLACTSVYSNRLAAKRLRTATQMFSLTSPVILTAVEVWANNNYHTSFFDGLEIRACQK